MMKTIVFALLFAGMASFAQEKITPEVKKAQRAESRLSPEQRNQLHLKKLTLELDLSAAQQKEMSKIIAEQGAKREALKTEMKAKREDGKKPTADDVFVMKNKSLDDKIAEKEKLKKILTPEQLDKWEKLRKDNRKNLKRGTGKFKDQKVAPVQE